MRTTIGLVSTAVAVAWSAGMAFGGERGLAETEAEKEALLEVRIPQAEAVVAFNNALATDQTVSRARLYLSAWREETAVPHPPGQISADLLALERRLRELEDRFTVLYQAHFGATLDRNNQTVERGPEAQRLRNDPAARAEARKKLDTDFHAARETALGLLQSVRASLADLRLAAGRDENIPRFEPLPDFTSKPSATLLADGAPTGILFGVVSYDKPVIDLLGFDYETGTYDSYNLQGTMIPIATAASKGRQSSVVVPCAVHGSMYCNSELWKTWLAEAGQGPVPILRPSHAGQQYVGQMLWPFDYYHPAVRKMLEAYLTEAGGRWKNDRRVLMYITAWEPQLSGGPGSYGQWPIDIRSPSALGAFHEYLQGKFETIERLNETCKAEYKSFEEIAFPPDIVDGPAPERGALVSALQTGGCPPLYYEFNRFVKDTYADYLAWCYRVLKKADPTHPVAISPSYGSLDGYLCTGRDSFLWAENACDIYGGELGGSMEEVFQYSIKRILGRTTVCMEYIWNESVNISDPPEEVVRAAVRRNAWRMAAWGRSAVSYFGAQDTYGGSGFNNILVFESGYHLLRRCAGMIERIRRELRSLEDVWLGAPVVEPRIAMLKPSTSQICSWPWEIVTNVTQSLHEMLYSRNYHYAFVPEEYVLSGKEDLGHFDVLILPYATHFPPGLTEKILPWVRSGGTLVIAGIAGGFTPHGARDGTLMKELFGDIGYEFWYGEGVGGDILWKINVRDLRPGVRDLSRGDSFAEVFQADYGTGKVLMAVRVKDWHPGGAVADAFYKSLDSAAPRTAWAEGDELEIVLREKENQLYAVLINPSVKDPARATIHFSRSYGLAVDRGIEGGFAAPLRQDGQEQALDLALAPGEGTVIVLTPPH